MAAVEDGLEDIGRSGQFHNYEEFIVKYSGSVLHPNHFLLMTATRNLIQYLTYGASNSESTDPELLRKKFELCRRFSSVLGKVGKFLGLDKLLQTIIMNCFLFNRSIQGFLKFATLCSRSSTFASYFCASKTWKVAKLAGFTK